ncbi:hypothetical protein J2T13_005060 [Paenibacillus sp. DS2015]
MLDLYMLLILAGAYTLFTGFLSWCGRMFRESEGDRR